MYPKLFTIPFINFTIHTFGVMVLLGALAAMQWVKYESNRRGLDGEEIVGIALEIFLAGLVGTRVLFVLQNWDFFADKSWFSMINIREGGLVWYGGPLTALPIIVWRLRNYPVNPLVICDIWAPGLAIGHALGRIGCFMAGDDYGRKWPHETWFTVTFTSPDALLPDDYRNVPLLPSQPLMFLGIFILFLILVGVRKRIAHKPAALPALYFTLYPIHRFFIEMIRDDAGAKAYHVPIVSDHFGPIRTSMIISVVMFPFSLAALIYFLRRPSYTGKGYVDWDYGPCQRPPEQEAEAPAKPAADLDAAAKAAVAEAAARHSAGEEGHEGPGDGDDGGDD